MLNKILDEIGIEQRESRFVKPPEPPFIVWFDEVEARGADDTNLIYEHGITLELYTENADKTPRESIERVLNKYGIVFNRTQKTWIESEGYYQEVFDFDYIEKREV